MLFAQKLSPLVFVAFICDMKLSVCSIDILRFGFEMFSIFLTTETGHAF